MTRSELLTKIKGGIIHPLVFAVYPIIALYAHNMGKGYASEAIWTTIFAFIAGALLWFLTNLLIKSKVRSALITSLFFFLFFSYGPALEVIVSILEKLQIANAAEFLGQGEPGSVIWLVFWGILFLAGSLLIVKLPGDLKTVSSFLNVVALALLAIMGFNLVVGGVNTYLMPHVSARSEQASDQPVSPLPTPASAGSEPLPVGKETPLAGEETPPAEGKAPPGGDSTRSFLPLIAKGESRVPAGSTGEGSDPADKARMDEFVSSWTEASPQGDADSSSTFRPDIYYIILDMYARSDFLQDVYGIDNSEFLSFLTEKGFYVANESNANYPYTTLSLPSSLNFMYLDQVAEQVGEDSTNLWPMVVMIKNNRTFQQLKEHGYTIVSFSSGYGISEIKGADVYMAPSGWRPSQFQNILMDSTPLVLLRKTQDDTRRELVRYTFDHLADAAEMDSPTFVFAHIPVPHYPFVFGANGERVRSKPEFSYEYDEFIEVYGNQVQFVTKEAQRTIKEILEKSPTPPIIIVQADHGPNSAAYRGEFVDLSEKFAILNAYYFPDQDYDDLSEGMTPVNTFRIIFNKYFGMSLEILENKSYFSSYSQAPFRFSDVTDELTRP